MSRQKQITWSTSVDAAAFIVYYIIKGVKSYSYMSFSSVYLAIPSKFKFSSSKLIIQTVNWQGSLDVVLKFFLFSIDSPQAADRGNNPVKHVHEFEEVKIAWNLNQKHSILERKRNH